MENDLIRRSDALKELWHPFFFTRAEIDMNVKNIPAVDAVEVVHSEWKFTGETDEWYGPVFRCKACGGEMIGDPTFCCDCGARMDGRREDGDE